MLLEETSLLITDETSGRLDHAVRQATGLSWSETRGLIDHGGVFRNGEVCTDAGLVVQAGDQLTIRRDPARKYREKPKIQLPSQFRIVFEDEHLMVVDKPAALLSVPTDHGEANTLLGAIEAYLKHRGQRASVVHRLDRGTSGLLVFGKSEQIAEELQSQFRIRKTERVYVAIVAGTGLAQSGTFRSQLGTMNNLNRYSVAPGEEGELAITHYRVEQVLSDTTLVRVNLETGRRNQIRVQFAEAGHPVLGEDRYRPKLAQHPNWIAKRLALHAARLGFVHPRTGESLAFESPLPEEFKRFLKHEG